MKENHRMKLMDCDYSGLPAFKAAVMPRQAPSSPPILPFKAVNTLSANAENESLVLSLCGNRQKQMGVISVLSSLKVSVVHGSILHLIESNLTQE